MLKTGKRLITIFIRSKEWLTDEEAEAFRRQIEKQISDSFRGRLEHVESVEGIVE